MEVPVPMTWPMGYKPLVDDMNREIRDPARFLLNQPRCKLYLAANVSISGTDWIPISWTAKVFDTDNMHNLSANNSRITIQTPGTYMLSATAVVGMVANSALSIALMKNGGVLQYSKAVAPPSALQIYATVTTLASLVDGDYIEVEISKNVTTSDPRQLVGGGERFTYVSVTRVANL